MQASEGDYVTGPANTVGTGAYVVDIDGTTLNLSVKNAGTFTAQLYPSVHRTMLLSRANI